MLEQAGETVIGSCGAVGRGAQQALWVDCLKVPQKR